MGALPSRVRVPAGVKETFITRPEHYRDLDTNRVLHSSAWDLRHTLEYGERGYHMRLWRRLGYRGDINGAAFCVDLEETQETHYITCPRRLMMASFHWVEKVAMDWMQHKRSGCDCQLADLANHPHELCDRIMNSIIAHDVFCSCGCFGDLRKRRFRWYKEQ